MRAGGILFFLAIGFLFIMIGARGNLGSVLGSIIDPSNMTEGSSSSGSNQTSTGSGSNMPGSSGTAGGGTSAAG